MIVRRFRVSDLAPLPWVNQGGVTREIACGRVTHSPVESWDWRLSVASIDKNGPISVLPGISRTSVLVDGALQLASESQTLMWDAPGVAHRYDGETPFEAHLRAPSARLFNVMVRRGWVGSNLEIHRADAVLESAHEETRCLLTLSGQFQVKLRSGTIILEAEEGLLCSHTEAALHVKPNSPEGCLAHVNLSPSRQNPP